MPAYLGNKNYHIAYFTKEQSKLLQREAILLLNTLLVNSTTKQPSYTQQFKIFSMKKLFTLVVAVCTMSAVFAQSGSRDRRDDDDRDHNYNQRTYQSNSRYGYGQGSYGVQGYDRDQRNRDYDHDRRYSRNYQQRNYGYNNAQYGYGDAYQRDRQYSYRNDREQYSRRMRNWNNRRSYNSSY